MFDMGAEMMALPLEEKMKYEQGDDGYSFGSVAVPTFHLFANNGSLSSSYKAKGATVTDETGKPDMTEFLNIAQDDAFAWPAIARREYPPCVTGRMDDAVVPFIKHSTEINDTLLGAFDGLLGLPAGTLAAKHAIGEFSGSEARVTHSPPRPNGIDESQAALAAHTDFGSLSFLHNRLGGLQVMVPGTTKWQYVKVHAMVHLRMPHWY